MAQTTSAADIENIVMDGLVTLGPDRSELGRDVMFESIDVDSLDLIELAQIVEDETGLHLEASDVKDVKTIGDVIDLIVSRLR
jgi:acyl carrier protein